MAKAVAWVASTQAMPKKNTRGTEGFPGPNNISGSHNLHLSSAGVRKGTKWIAILGLSLRAKTMGEVEKGSPEWNQQPHHQQIGSIL